MRKWADCAVRSVPFHSVPFHFWSCWLLCKMSRRVTPVLAFLTTGFDCFSPEFSVYLLYICRNGLPAFLEAEGECLFPSLRACEINTEPVCLFQRIMSVGDGTVTFTHCSLKSYVWEMPISSQVGELLPSADGEQNTNLFEKERDQNTM